MEIQTDFLVLGSGIAGLCFAIKASATGTVAVVSKKEKIESNTNYAQGGIAAVTGEHDSFASHIRDTLECGDGLCSEDIVRMVVTEGPERTRELITWGVEFTRGEIYASEFDLGKEGGHSHRRVLHADDQTGREIERALIEKAGDQKNITIYENHFAVNLICESHLRELPEGAEDTCLGAYVFDTVNNCVHTFRARFVMLATGGSGKVYLITTNPDIATGDGIAMAYRAGAEISNMEFIQFHPTCLSHPEATSFLISEALRGEGGILRLKNGTPFMERYHPMKDLAPRDIVARAIDAELKKTGDDHVLLDMSHRSRQFLKKRFPAIYGTCVQFGIDMAVDAIPVAPAAHYQCGGVAINAFGETNIRRLFACGEVACSGLHGANRLASNSLLEAVVIAHRAYSRVCSTTDAGGYGHLSIPPWNPGGATPSDESVLVSHNWEEIRLCMSNYVGIVRSDKRLERAWRRIDLICQEINEYYWNFTITADLLELRNLAAVAKIIIECARTRKESRGLHYNIDYPERDDINWRKDTAVMKGR